MDDSGVRIVFSTAPDEEVARELAGRLVRERRAACVSLLPGTRSIYWWEGEVQSDEEVLLVIKTGAGQVDALTEALGEAHPYDCPEILAVPVVAGLEDYLDWVGDSVD